MNYVKQWGNYCDIVDCIRMTWSVPAAVPQMMKLQVNNFMFTVACDDDDDDDDDGGGDGDRGSRGGDGGRGDGGHDVS